MVKHSTFPPFFSGGSNAGGGAGPPNGPAGGHLYGTYPNPSVDEAGAQGDPTTRMYFPGAAEWAVDIAGVEVLLVDADGLHLGQVDVDGNIAARAVTPGALGAGATDDYAGAAGRTWARLTANAAGSTVTGFTGGVDGGLMIVVNLGAGLLTISHQHVGSSAANRVITSTGLDIDLATNDTATFIYDSVTARWRQITGVA